MVEVWPLVCSQRVFCQRLSIKTVFGKALAAEGFAAGMAGPFCANQSCEEIAPLFVKLNGLIVPLLDLCLGTAVEVGVLEDALQDTCCKCKLPTGQ